MSTETPQKTQEQTELEAERTALILQMQKLDGEEPVSADEPQTDPQAGNQSPATAEEASVDDGSSVLKEGETPKPVEGEGDAKLAKEAARKERTWKQINEEREKLANERAEIARLKVEAATKAAQAGKYTPEDYLAAARRWEAEGETEYAAEARAKAQSLKAEIAAIEENAKREAFKAEWQDAVRQAKEDRPELEDPNSELTKLVQEAFRNRPVFQTYPGGVADAVRFAELGLTERKVNAIQAERDKLQAKVDELEKKLQPGGATPTAATNNKPKSFEDMTLAEQGEYWRKVAKAADRGGGVAEFIKN